MIILIIHKKNTVEKLTQGEYKTKNVGAHTFMRKIGVYQ